MSERLEGAKEGRAWVASVASPVSVTGGRRDAEDRAAARVAPRADGTWPPPIDEATLVALLSKHAVAGVSMAMITPGEGGHGADGSRVEGGVGAVMRTLNLPTSIVIVPNVDDNAALRLHI